LSPRLVRPVRHLASLSLHARGRRLRPARQRPDFHPGDRCRNRARETRDSTTPSNGRGTRPSYAALARSAMHNLHTDGYAATSVADIVAGAAIRWAPSTHFTQRRTASGMWSPSASSCGATGPRSLVSRGSDHPRALCGRAEDGAALPLWLGQSTHGRCTCRIRGTIAPT
jgi:hypothetical protein